MEERPASKYDLNDLQTYWHQVHRDLTVQQSASCPIDENNPALGWSLVLPVYGFLPNWDAYRIAST